MRQAEPLCAENIGLKNITQSRRGGGGTNFSGRPNNVQLSPHIISVQEDQELEQAI